MSMTMIVTGVMTCLLSAPPTGTVHYVRAGAAPGGDGTSWMTAYPQVTDALAVAQPDEEIWVASGMYDAITLADGVAVYGGFGGFEIEREARDPMLNETVLGDGLSTVEGHVVLARQVSDSALLDGFVIRNNVAPDDAVGGIGGAGGGVFIEDASPRFVNCRIVDNRARIGAGVYCIDGSPVFESCAISSNTGATSADGAGIYAATTPGLPTQILTLLNCDVSYNFAPQGHYLTGNGAGLYCAAGVDLFIDGCTFRGNFGAHNTTYGNAQRGGGVLFLGDLATISNSIFMENISAYGAGICNEGIMQCINCVFIGNRAVGVGCGGPECGGAPDVASGYGGGLYTALFGATTDLINCTLHANWAYKEAGGAHVNGIVRNSIISGNETPPACCGEDPLPRVRSQLTGNVDVAFSCVEALLTPEPGEDPIDPTNYPGSTQADPVFVQPYVVSASFGWLLALGDIRLDAGSPCIDAGDNGAVPAGIVLDVAGNARFADDAMTPDVGLGDAPIVDLGAYEVPAPALPGDANGDCTVDITDLNMVLGNFGSAGPSGDVTDNGSVDIADLNMVLGNFGTSCQ